MGEAVERARAVQDDVIDAVASARNKATGIAQEAQDAASGLADNMGARAADAAGNVTDKIKTGVDAAAESATDSMARARDTVSEATKAVPEKARRVVGDNAVLIGSLGVAIGAIIAASLPTTRAEASTLGDASDGAKQAAGDAIQSGLEAAKNAAASVADAALKSVADVNLGGRASQTGANLTDLKEPPDELAKTAFNPSANSNT
jgi:hypothetical protein